jgi:hypothetical protein
MKEFVFNGYGIEAFRRIHSESRSGANPEGNRGHQQVLTPARARVRARYPYPASRNGV